MSDFSTLLFYFLTQFETKASSLPNFLPHYKQKLKAQLEKEKNPSCFFPGICMC